MNKQGIVHVWYVDDVLIVGRTPQEAEHQAAATIRLLTDVGIQVNQEKSMEFLAQKIPYLGLILDLEANKVHYQLEKVVHATKMLRARRSVMMRTLFEPLFSLGKTGVQVLVRASTSLEIGQMNTDSEYYWIVRATASDTGLSRGRN